MSFNLPTIELKVSDDMLTTKASQEFDHLSRPCKIIDHAQIADEDFLLVLLLTSEEDLLVHYKLGTSSQFASVSIRTLFSKKSFSHLALVTITVDCSMVIFISFDGQTIFLVPFCAFMDVPWGQKSTLLVSLPTCFSLFGLESVGNYQQKNSQICTAICFQSLTDHTYLIFGDLNGSLFLVNLNLRRIVVKTDLKSAICSLHIFEEISRQQLLVSLSDRSQMILPLEDGDASTREIWMRITQSKILLIDKNLDILRLLNGSVCVMDSLKNQLSVFDSLSSVSSLAPPILRLECFATANICQVICTPQMIATLTLQGDLFVHLRVLQPENANGSTVRYKPMKIIFTSDSPLKFNEKVLHLIPPTTFTMGNERESMECFSIITETGLFTLYTRSPLNDFISAHLKTQFYSAVCLSTIADSLHISPGKLCLSLLRHSLGNSSIFDIDQINGIISLAFKCKVDLSVLLSVLHDSNREDILLPFLRTKIDKGSSDDACSIRQSFLDALLARISYTIEETKTVEENKRHKNLEEEKDALELELRNFLVKFDVNESVVLLLLLRHFLLSCVAVLLCRNATLHSATVARFLLELPDWKSIKRIGRLLKCLSLIHWPSVDSYSSTIVAKLFNLVPFCNATQLKIVNKIAKLLSERSIDSSCSLHLFCLMYLSHLSPANIAFPNCAPLKHKNSMDSGPNCTVLIGEDACGSPYFWGEFCAGTQRLLRNSRENANGDEQFEQQFPSGKRRLPRLFKLTSTPQAVKLPNFHLEFCSVACGTEHVLLLTVDGRLFSWGVNRFGQCGNGTEEPIPTPIEIKGEWGSVVSIFAGHYHSAFISDKDELYLWGWGLHGQLGNGGIANLRRPSKSCLFNVLGRFRTICLGYSHTLALCSDGRVFGCGALSFGQLGVDPRELEGCPMKALNPIQLPLPMPISLMASKYFYGIALGMDHQKRNVLFEWGESPQSLKMKVFLQKRLRSKQKKAMDKTLKSDGNSYQSTAECAQRDNRSDESIAATADLPRVHLRIRTLCEWEGGAVKALSAGFNHSALLTVDGELFTWGKSLEMQLGHRNRKEKAQPTKVDAPNSIRWSEVVCARNFTTAISTEGKVFVWGRNDKSQLGLGTTTKALGQIRRIALKSDKGVPSRSVELPADNCVEMATIVPGMRAFVQDAEQSIPDGLQLNEMFTNVNQNSLNVLSRFLVKHPLPNFTVVQVHLMSGDLLAALRLLVSLLRREGLLSETMSPLSPSNRVEHSNSSLPLSSSESQRSLTVMLKSTFCSSSFHASGQLPMQFLELCYTFIDKIWALLRVHPIREVQTCALVELLNHRFPIYNRLAMDLYLCRLIDPFLTLPNASSYSEISASVGACSVSSTRVRFTEIGMRQRAIRLRLAKVTDLDGIHFRALKDRCDKLLAQESWCFFSDCGHFEKCAVGNGPARIKLANLRRRCTKCVGKAMETAKTTGQERKTLRPTDETDNG